MNVGKLPNSMLEEIILKKIKKIDDKVIIKPDIGEDCSAVEIGGELLYITTDPITAASVNSGKLALNICCNDLASCGIVPRWVLTTVLMPEGSTKNDIEEVFKEIADEAKRLDISIIGGHTEVTNAVNRVVISVTGMGVTNEKRVNMTKKARPGDSLIMTKTAGIEGTAVFAYDYEELLKKTLEVDIIKNAKRMLDDISVVKEGLIAAKAGVTAMHDITEGGILGAVWEICKISDTGAVVNKHDIPVAYETMEICSLLNIDPLKLISSGSMLICHNDPETLIADLEKNGVNACVIGQITKEAGIFLKDGDEMSEINEPGSDELYKYV